MTTKRIDLFGPLVVKDDRDAQPIDPSVWHRSTPMIDHGDVVKSLHASMPPARSLEGALDFLVRLVLTLQRRFPAERVGLLIKTAGENIVPYAGTSVSAGRICYPDADLLVKVLTDVPSTNGPSWQTEEGIPNTGHHGGYLAVTGPPTEPGQPKPPDTGTLPGGLEGQVSRLLVRVAKLEAEAATKTRVEQINERMNAVDRAAVKYPLPLYRGEIKVFGYTLTVVSEAVP